MMNRIVRTEAKIAGENKPPAGKGAIHVHTHLVATNVSAERIENNF